MLPLHDRSVADLQLQVVAVQLCLLLNHHLTFLCPCLWPAVDQVPRCASRSPAGTAHLSACTDDLVSKHSSVKQEVSYFGGCTSVAAGRQAQAGCATTRERGCVECAGIQVTLITKHWRSPIDKIHFDPSVAITQNIPKQPQICGIWSAECYRSTGRNTATPSKGTFASSPFTLSTPLAR